MRESVTVTILPAKPIPAVTAVTDTAGLVGIAAPNVTKELHLGPLSAGASILNDRSAKNILTNLLGLVDGFDGPMATTGAFNDFLDWGVNSSTPGRKRWGRVAHSSRFLA